MRARRDIERGLADSASLRAAVAGMISDEMPSVRRLVAATLAAFGEQPRVEIDGLTYSPDQVLGEWFAEG